MIERRHATTVAIAGRAVMIVGPSGSGKSDLALRLIDRGAKLVSDDYTECGAAEGIVTANVPATIDGRMEVRGLGIIAMPHLDGIPVSLVVQLGEPVQRMPEPMSYIIAETKVPAIALNAFEASAPIKVEMALARLVERTQ